MRPYGPQRSKQIRLIPIRILAQIGTVCQWSVRKTEIEMMNFVENSMPDANITRCLADVSKNPTIHDALTR